jgi:hypothetical protein
MSTFFLQNKGKVKKNEALKRNLIFVLHWKHYSKEIYKEN